MVYKIEKHGVRTGNSIKGYKSKTRRLQRYRRQSYLVRSHIVGKNNTDVFDHVQFEKASGFGEGDSIRDGVEYSLNKQRRWELPKILENIILGDEQSTEFDVQLIERHRLYRMANCISVSSTGGVFRNGKLSDERRFKAKNSSGYFQSNSVLNKQPKVSRRDRRRRRNRHDTPEENTEEITQESNKIRYEVHYPCPASSYLTQDAKKVGLLTPDSFRWEGYQDKRKRKTRREKLSRHIQESLSCIDDALEDSLEESSVEEADDTDTRLNKFDITLHDILQHAHSAKNLTERKKRHSSDGSHSLSESDTVKRHVVYVEDDATKNATPPVSTATHRHRTELKPVHVILKNAMVSPQELSNSFGKKYVECECFPRKFIINISDNVSKLRINSSENSNCFRTEACLVLVHDTDNEINNVAESVFKLFLNASFGDSLQSVKIETVFEYMETTVEDIVQRTLFFIETLPLDSIQCEASPFTVSRTKRGTVEECANWFSGSYRPSNSYLLEHFIARSHNVQEAVSLGYEFVSRFDAFELDDSDNVVSQRDRFCCICYLELYDMNPGTALNSCSHWFCDWCWKEYIETKTSSGSTDLLCPEFDCDRVVDPGTVLSLIGMRDVVQYAKRCHDTEVEQQITTRWCPNHKCDRVLQRSSEDVKTSRCACGVEVCFECLEAPHWPASCQASKSYYKKIRDSGDIAIEPVDLMKQVVVRGKPCPKCFKFIEKNGGCPSMVCVCGAHFCWGCGCLWETRTHGTDCYKYGYKDTHGTTERTFPRTNPLEKRNIGRLYKLALQHRVNRHPRRLSQMRAHTKSMSKRIQNYISHTEFSGEKFSLEFDDPSTTEKRDADKVVAYLSNTLQLYSEINFLVENTAVLLNSEELPMKSSLVLRYITRRLSSFAGVIHELFENNKEIHASVLVQRLKDVRFHSRKTVQSLIRCLKKMSDGQKTQE